MKQLLPLIFLGLLLPAPLYAVVVADPAADYNRFGFPAGWQYLRSNASSGGTENNLSTNITLGNGGNRGYGGNGTSGGGGFLYDLPNILGSATGFFSSYEIFNDGDLNNPVEGTDLLMHPGNPAEASGDEYVIARYTFSAADVTNGTKARITGNFRNLIAVGNSVSVWVYHNENALFTVNGGTLGVATTLSQAEGTFDVTANVAAGDTISFVVGSNDNFGGDETALRANIDLSVADQATGGEITVQKHYTFNDNQTPAGVTVEAGTPTYNNGQLQLNGGTWLASPSGINVTDNYGVEAIVTAGSFDATDFVATMTSNTNANSGVGLAHQGSWKGIVQGLTFFGSSSSSTGTEVRLAFVRDGGVNRFYVNGTQVTTDLNLVGNGGDVSMLNIGANRFDAADGNGLFNGSINEVRTFTFAAGKFSASELLQEPTTTAAIDDQFNVGLSMTANLDVLANDIGADLDASSLRVTTPGTGATAVQPDGTINYTDSTGVFGNDSFQYSIDNLAGTETFMATVNITVSNGLKVANSTLTFSDNPPVGGYQFPEAFPGLTFVGPTNMEHQPGNTQRLFISERTGRIWLIPDVTAATPVKQLFLDLSGQTGGGTFSGLRGLVFHPDFATNRQFFVAYKDTSNRTKVSRFLANAGNLDTASASSETVLFEQGNYFIHGINKMAFGPDGYLYIAIGDANNATGTSQKIDEDWWSSILRIDVDKKPGNFEPANTSGVNLDGSGNAYYSVPADNPFVDQTAADGRGISSYLGQSVNPNQVRTEMYCIGFRNPWKIGFVPGTNDLWVSNVADGGYETFRIMPKGGNAGWGYFEGTRVGPNQSGSTPPSGNNWVQPVLEYLRVGSGATVGSKAIIGGLFYESSDLAELTGSFLFCDYERGDIWYMKRPNNSAYQIVGRSNNGNGTYNIDRTGMITGDVISEGSNLQANHYGVSEIVRIGTAVRIAGMALDPSDSGSVLLMESNFVDGDGAPQPSVIRRLVFSADDGSLPATLSATGAFSDLSTLTPNPGIEPYDINLTFWSDNAIKNRFFSIADIGDTITYSEDSHWTFPAGSVFIKHFNMDMDRQNPGTDIKRLETRFLIKTADDFYGVSYRWNEAETEATLVDSEGVNFDLQITDEDGSMRTQTWRIPARGECRICHTDANGTMLGFNTRQLNKTGSLGGTAGNVLDLMRNAGYLSGMAVPASTLPKHYHPADTSVDLETRARSYLDVNCSYCHYTGSGQAPSSWSGEEHLTIEQTNLLHGEAIGFGVVDPTDRLIIPGNTTKSIILSRVSETNGYGRMPPLATSITDPEGIQLLTDWINLHANAKPEIGSAGPYNVAENTGSGTSVGAGPSSTDADSPDAARGTLTYSIIAGNDSGYFAIDPGTGEISLAKDGPDFEEGASQTLTVQVTDGYAPNPGTVTAEVVVQVSDVANDDTQGDGILDDWAVANLGASLINPMGDSDGDGSIELFEFWGGGDPNDPTSLGLRILPLGPAIGGSPGQWFEWVIRNDLTLGTNYVLQGSELLNGFNPMAPGTDFTIDSTTPVDGDHSRIRIRVPSSKGQRYFLRLGTPEAN